MHMCVDAHTQSLKNEKFKAVENICKVVRDNLEEEKTSFTSHVTYRKRNPLLQVM